MIKFLSYNLDVFAWCIANMPGIDPEIICHKLSIRVGARPVKQKARRINVERSQALNEEVYRLLKAEFIRETLYPEWLANPVLVKKKNGKWRVCIDFTNLNEACPKDPFPYPELTRQSTPLRETNS
jgi:hypothetical protein